LQEIASAARILFTVPFRLVVAAGGGAYELRTVTGEVAHPCSAPTIINTNAQ
jgi:hypothetical protein